MLKSLDFVVHLFLIEKVSLFSQRPKVPRSPLHSSFNVSPRHVQPEPSQRGHVQLESDGNIRWKLDVISMLDYPRNGAASRL